MKFIVPGIVALGLSLEGYKKLQPLIEAGVNKKANCLENPLQSPQDTSSKINKPLQKWMIRFSIATRVENFELCNQAPCYF